MQVDVLVRCSLLSVYIVNNDVSGDDCVTAHDFLSLVLVSVFCGTEKKKRYDVMLSEAREEFSRHGARRGAHLLNFGNYFPTAYMQE